MIKEGWGIVRVKDVIQLSIVIFCGFLFSCNKNKVPESEEKIQALETVRDFTKEAEVFSDSLLTVLTLEERIGQCLMPSLPALSDSSNLVLLRHYIRDFHIGGIVLLRGDLKSASMIAEECSMAKVPMFIAIDAEWGLGMRLEDAPVYPKNGILAKEINPIQFYDYGREIASQSREVGVNMVLGPVLDVSSDLNRVIGKRSFGNNAEEVASFGVAYAKGLESGGVISVAKHFPGHGFANSDSHKNVASLSRGISLLDSIDLRPFREYIDAGLTAVMAGHIEAKALDPSGNPASTSIDILTSLLREELGFKGLILTDAFDMGGADGFSATDALKAGADIVLCPRDLQMEYMNLLENVKSGELKVEIINNRCRRILFTKYLFGIIH